LVRGVRTCRKTEAIGMKSVPASMISAAAAPSRKWICLGRCPSNRPQLNPRVQGNASFARSFLRQTGRPQALNIPVHEIRFVTEEELLSCGLGAVARPMLQQLRDRLFCFSLLSQHAQRRR